MLNPLAHRPTKPNFLFSIALVLVLAITTQTHAQRRGVALYDPQGVFVDPDGVLKTKTVAKGKALRLLLNKTRIIRKDHDLRYISLPRLFAQVRKLQEAGKPIPDDIKYLGGITKLQYLFVDSKNKDLIIVGRAEKIDKQFPGRPMGVKTGRPVLQLDDLVVALRTVGPGKQIQPFGVNIEQTKRQQNAMVAVFNSRIADLQIRSKRASVFDAMAKAAGPQTVRLINLAPDTRFALVCLEADYLMKRLAIGLYKSPVPAVRSYLSLRKSLNEAPNRFWFEAKYDALLTSPDGTAFKLQGQSLQILTQEQFQSKENAKSDPAADGFASQATKYFDDLAHFIPSFADLANLTDLSVFAALINQENLHKKINWNMAWVLDAKSGYPVPRVKVPTTAETLVNYNLVRLSPRQHAIIHAAGGVLLKLNKTIRNRKSSSADFTNAQKSIPAGWQTLVPHSATKK